MTSRVQLLTIMLLLNTVILLPGLLAADALYTLEVEVQGAQPGIGQALFALYDSPESFLREPLAKQRRGIDAEGKAYFTVEGLPPGTYAVSVVYDVDSNGKLDTGFLGIPVEPIALSNNAKARFGPPSFADAKFELAASMKKVITFGKVKE
jgi:uncharacterized protein (DUF2141 family)